LFLIFGQPIPIIPVHTESSFSDNDFQLTGTNFSKQIFAAAVNERTDREPTRAGGSSEGMRRPKICFATFLAVIFEVPRLLSAAER
jgi:hypothetical protein